MEKFKVLPSSSSPSLIWLTRESGKVRYLEMRLNREIRTNPATVCWLYNGQIKEVKVKEDSFCINWIVFVLI
jgi:hypothetical protein